MASLNKSTRSWPPDIEAKSSLNLVDDEMTTAFSMEDIPYRRAEIDVAELMPKVGNVAAHCAIYTKTADSRRALVLMHMRFDGKFGFAGGLIDPEDASVVQGLNRELREELNLDTSRFEIKEGDFLMCSYSDKGKEAKVLNYRYFFAKEVSGDEFKSIELESLRAKDYGREVMGPVRVPLTHPFHKESRVEEISSFQNFMKNNFVEKANEQLVLFLYYAEIMSLEELSRSVPKSGHTLEV